MTTPQPTAAGPSAPGRWPAWQSVIVRYLTLHWLLYAFPKPFAELPQTLLYLPANVAGTGNPLPGWAITALDTINGWAKEPKAWWEAALTWLEQQNMTFGAEMIHTATIQSDTCAAWTRVAYIGITAALLTAIWSLIDRRRSGHPALGRWLHLGARWYLALAMLTYAWPKFVGGQFPHPTIQQLTSEVGDLNPSSVLWRFMGNSTTYTWIAGLGELLGFALLLHRRTTLLGAVITTGVMANVCAFNWLYDVPLKQYSTHLLLIAVFLMAPFRHRIWALFWSNSNSDPVDLRVTKSPWLGWPLLALGTFWAIGACANAGIGNLAWRERASTTSHAIPELFGLWQVESMTLAGELVSRTDTTFWRDIAIDRGNQLRIRTITGKPYHFGYAEDPLANTITLRPRANPEATIEWQAERSTVTRKGFHPAPRQPEDFRTMVDTERDAATFRGEWEGQPFEVTTVKKRFNYDRKSRFITEWPK